VREGRFREDLYYRLAGIGVQLPALRERSDKLELIRAILATECGPDASLSPEAERTLMEYHWPGNIRQLGHVLRAAAALSDGSLITREHLPSLAVNLHPAHYRRPAHTPGGAIRSAPTDSTEGEYDDNAPCGVSLSPIQINERQMLLEMLEQHRWNVSNVAKALDVSRNTLYRKIHKLQIEVSHPEQGQ
jgi:transcriptional regulator of acetoin/glycerol metabolism